MSLTGRCHTCTWNSRHHHSYPQLWLDFDDRHSLTFRNRMVYEASYPHTVIYNRTHTLQQWQERWEFLQTKALEVPQPCLKNAEATVRLRELLNCQTIREDMNFNTLAQVTSCVWRNTPVEMATGVNERMSQLRRCLWRSLFCGQILMGGALIKLRDHHAFDWNICGLAWLGVTVSSTLWEICANIFIRGIISTNSRHDFEADCTTKMYDRCLLNFCMWKQSREVTREFLCIVRLEWKLQCICVCFDSCDLGRKLWPQATYGVQKYLNDEYKLNFDTLLTEIMCCIKNFFLLIYQ